MFSWRQRPPQIRGLVVSGEALCGQVVKSVFGIPSPLPPRYLNCEQNKFPAFTCLDLSLGQWGGSNSSSVVPVGFLSSRKDNNLNLELAKHETVGFSLQL